MTSILEVSNLSKSYNQSNYALKNVNFSISEGSIVGFIGENGAGKSTTMGSILGTVQKDTGTIHIFGEIMTPDNKSLKENIGVVFDDIHLPDNITVNQLNHVFQNIYKQWSEETFFSYIDFFSLPKTTKISGFSRGMSMKLSVAAALSHEAKFLILDEATAGLDPSGRDELLDVLYQFVHEGNRSILLSSHITSDIEKIADFLVFIKDGKILLKVDKQQLINQYGIFKCTVEEYKEIDQSLIVSVLDKEDGAEVLVSDKNQVPHHIFQKTFTIDDISLFLMRGERQ